MASVTDIMRQVIHCSERSPYPFYRSIALRCLERTLSIAPFFVAYVWLSHTMASGVSGSELALPLDDLTTVWIGAGVLALMLAGQLLFSYLGQLQSFLSAYELTRGYRESLINQVRRLPLGQLHQQRAGHLASMLTDDVNRVEKIFTHLTAELAAAVLVPLLLWLPLLWIDWRLAAALMLPLPAGFLLLHITRRGFLQQVARKQTHSLDVSGLLVEYVAGIKTLRLFNQAAVWLRTLDGHFQRMRQQSMRVEAWGAGPLQVYRLALELSLVLLLLVGAQLAAADALSTLHWLLFAMLAYKLIDPLLEAAAFWAELRAMAQSGTRIAALLDQPGAAFGQEFCKPDTFEVHFERVGFRYHDEWVLRDITFTAPAGRVTAIVGPSGAGKSTLMQLIARFYAPQTGVISLGGIDLSTLHSDALYGHLSVVFQDVQLFDGSVLENVRIGQPTASDTAVIAACRAAWCHDFVSQLPQGYHTRIGEDGQRLSGGERQRLSIARALLRDAPVLLLDEATASVDPDTQYEIQQAISALVGQRTVIVIAHRLHTIQYADQILVLDQGQLVEHGDHRSLLEQNGLYRTLWQEQTASHQPTD